MANEVRTFTLNDDPGQVIEDLNAAFDGTTQTGLKAETANNVTTSINGKAIAEIFEPDGVTVKKATHAESASGDTRFQISGNFGGEGTLVSAFEGNLLYSTSIFLPIGKSLVIKQARFKFSWPELRLRVDVDAEGNIYMSSASAGDEKPNFTVGNTGIGVTHTLSISVYNTGSEGRVCSGYDGWWLDLAIE